MSGCTFSWRIQQNALAIGLDNASTNSMYALLTLLVRQQIITNGKAWTLQKQRDTYDEAMLMKAKKTELKDVLNSKVRFKNETNAKAIGKIEEASEEDQSKISSATTYTPHFYSIHT